MLHRIFISGLQFSNIFVQKSRLIYTPFDPGKRHLLLILSYQRSGSSFIGDIFGKNDDVIYIYEPLDGLYVHLYGSKQGWNVPSDITNYPNGSPR